MSARRIVPTFDELEDGHARLRLGAELAPVEQLAFEGGEEALAHRVVVGVTDRSHGRPHAGLLASQAEGDRGVLGGLKWSSQHSEVGGCDGYWKATIGTVWTSTITFTRTAACCGAI